MSAWLITLGLLAWWMATLAVVLGRNLTRSVVAGQVFIALLCLTLLFAGGGFLALLACLLAAVSLASIQLFGWMLVDVDRDHLAPTDRGTALARGTAFAVLGLGLGLLIYATRAEWAGAREGSGPGITAIGEALFGPLGALVILVGMTVGAALLATQSLLRDDEEGDR